MPLVFSEKLMFLHLPKTGGNSVSWYLVESLPRPVWYQGPHPWLNREGVHYIHGNPHPTMADAAKTAKRCGFELKSFPIIFAVLRNPYEVEVSSWAFHRQRIVDAEPAPGSRQALARSLPFSDYVLEDMRQHDGKRQDVKKMLTIDGRMPKNMELIPFQQLGSAVKEVLAAVGIESGITFPQINMSQHLQWETYYSAESEAAVYEAYRWMFDGGLFPRLERNPMLARI